MTTTTQTLRASRRTWEQLVDFLPFHMGIAIQWQAMGTGADAFDVTFNADDAELVCDAADALELVVTVEESSLAQIERLRANADSCFDPMFADWLRKFANSWEAERLNAMMNENEVVEVAF